MESVVPTLPSPPAKRGLARLWRRARRRWYTRWPIDIGIIMFIFWGIGRWQSRYLLDDDTPAPAFTLKDIDGNIHALSDWRGKVVLIQFFAPWCTVCRLEMDNWARIQSMRSSVQVVAVALAYEDEASVIDFIGSDRGAYPVLLGNDAVQRAWKVESFPTHYVIDADGRIRSQSTGYSPTIGMFLRLL